MSDKLRTRLNLKLLTAPVAVVALAAVVAGCGNDVPSGAVAKVADEVVTKKEFEHWLGAAARSQQPPGAGATATVSVPKPPDFKECVDTRAKQPVPKGAKKPDPKALRDQCKQEYEGLKQQVMQFLISADWIQQEAE